jgi:hypothetical protein
MSVSFLPRDLAGGAEKAKGKGRPVAPTQRPPAQDDVNQGEAKLNVHRKK